MSIKQYSRIYITNNFGQYFLAPSFSLINCLPFSTNNETSENTKTQRRTIRKRVRKRTKMMRKQVAIASEGAKLKLVDLWKKYGMVALTTYFGLYFVTLRSTFLLFDQGLLANGAFGMSIEEMLDTVCEKLEAWEFLKTYTPLLRENPKIGTFAVAWLTTKLTEPARAIVTISVTPKLAKYAREKGWIEYNKESQSS